MYNKHWVSITGIQSPDWSSQEKLVNELGLERLALEQKWGERVQAYLGDIAGSVPDHCNKANIILKKQLTQIFWFPSAYKSYVYPLLLSINCAIALCLKNGVHTLIKKLYC